jgi:hypothetical protein
MSGAFMTNARHRGARFDREEITVVECARSGRIFVCAMIPRMTPRATNASAHRMTTRHSVARDIAPIAFASLST